MHPDPYTEALDEHERHVVAHHVGDCRHGP